MINNPPREPNAPYNGAMLMRSFGPSIYISLQEATVSNGLVPCLDSPNPPTTHQFAMMYTGFASLGLIFGYTFALPQATSSSLSLSSCRPTPSVPASSDFDPWMQPSSARVHRRQFSTGFPSFTQSPSGIASAPSSPADSTSASCLSLPAPPPRAPLPKSQLL